MAFINLVSGSKLAVGSGLQSCTSSVQATAPFDMDGRKVILIDTPGFDDTTKSDSDILKLVAHFLSTTYQQGVKLSGIIYMHRISDFRMGGTAMRNFTMFKQLCGEEFLNNVVIVTSMWSEVIASIGEAREVELRDQEMFFKPVLARGARLLRLENKLESAQAIVRSMILQRPTVLKIQYELVDQNLGLADTAAGQELNRDIAAQERAHREELKSLQLEMRAAMQARDEQTRKELQETSSKLQLDVARLQADSRKLVVDYAEEKLRMERQVQAMIEATRGEVDRVTLDCQRQMEDLQRRFQRTETSNAAEKSDLQRQMETLQYFIEDRTAGGGGGTIGNILGHVGWVIGIVLRFI
ncbi:hypothetical protein HWV62_31347 [Athelia sp. TMB]|nr:hypothetical protein HWV62_31347 [Athelia sp. TMB]